MQTAGRFLRGLFGTSHSIEDAEHEARARAFQEQVERLRQARAALQLYSDAVDALSKDEVVVAESFDAYYKACPPPSSGEDTLPRAWRWLRASGRWQWKNIAGRERRLTVLYKAGA